MFVAELLIALRLLGAFLLVITCILLGWFLAWKLILVHIPLVQEIFGLRKKPKEPKPPTGRLLNLYKDTPKQNYRTEGSNTLKKQ